jgi:hypothetical protein
VLTGLQCLGVVDEPFEPGQLVVEFRPRLGVAVGQVQAPNQYAVHGGFQIATLLSVRITGQAPSTLQRLRIARQNGDAVPRRLAMPDRPVAHGLERTGRKILVGSLELLKTDDVRFFAFEPRKEVGLVGTNTVDVERRDLEFFHPRSAPQAGLPCM